MKGTIQNLVYKKASTTKFCEDTDPTHESPLRMIAMLEFADHNLLAVLAPEKSASPILYLHQMEITPDKTNFTVGNFVHGIALKEVSQFRVDYNSYELSDKKLISFLAHYDYRGFTETPIHGVLSAMHDGFSIIRDGSKIKVINRKFSIA